MRVSSGVELTGQREVRCESEARTEGQKLRRMVRSILEQDRTKAGIEEDEKKFFF